jgi:hypothetical protein
MLELDAAAATTRVTMTRIALLDFPVMKAVVMNHRMRPTVYQENGFAKRTALPPVRSLVRHSS